MGWKWRWGILSECGQTENITFRLVLRTRSVNMRLSAFPSHFTPIGCWEHGVSVVWILWSLVFFKNPQRGGGVKCTSNYRCMKIGFVRFFLGELIPFQLNFSFFSIYN